MPSRLINLPESQVSEPLRRQPDTLTDLVRELACGARAGGCGQVGDWRTRRRLSTEQERLSVRRGEGVFEPQFTPGIYRRVPESEPDKG
jgi:hypothetical protein